MSSPAFIALSLVRGTGSSNFCLRYWASWDRSVVGGMSGAGTSTRGNTYQFSRLDRAQISRVVAAYSCRSATLSVKPTPVCAEGLSSVLSLTTNALALTMSVRIASEILEVTNVTIDAGMMMADRMIAHIR